MTVDGVLSPEEWADFESTALRTPLVDVRLQNSATRLYLAVAFLADYGTRDIAARGAPRDSFRLFVDLDRDGEPTPEVDLLVAPASDGSRLEVRRSAAPGWGRPRTVPGGELRSSSASEPGSLLAHRIWEVGIPLRALGLSATDVLPWGIELTSAVPQLMLTVPARSSSDYSRMQRTQLSPFRVLRVTPVVLDGPRLLRAGEQVVPFELGGAEPEPLTVPILLQVPGRLELDATWEGTANELRLELRAPGGEEPVVRWRGGGPLSASIQVPPAWLARGSGWSLVVRPPVAGRQASGSLSIRPPRPGSSVPTPQAGEVSGSVVREILPDGRIQLTHPDGRVMVYGDGGYDVYHPDGRVGKGSFNQVQVVFPEEPPSAAELPWLESHAERLLEHIAELTRLQEDAVENYLAREGERANSVYERIYWRTRCIGILL